jgi:hypothetical protein
MTHSMRNAIERVFFRPTASATAPRMRDPIITPDINSDMVKGDSQVRSHTKFHSELMELVSDVSKMISAHLDVSPFGHSSTSLEPFSNLQMKDMSWPTKVYWSMIWAPYMPKMDKRRLYRSCCLPSSPMWLKTSSMFILSFILSS